MPPTKKNTNRSRVRELRGPLRQNESFSKPRIGGLNSRLEQGDAPSSVFLRALKCATNQLPRGGKGQAAVILRPFSEISSCEERKLWVRSTLLSNMTKPIRHNPEKIWSAESSAGCSNGKTAWGKIRAAGNIVSTPI